MERIDFRARKVDLFVRNGWNKYMGTKIKGASLQASGTLSNQLV